jgi:HEPN domain-containing protein
MAQPPEEWLRQVDCDMETADSMFAGGRYFYAVVMCHLSIEKFLKGSTGKSVVRSCPEFTI